MKDGQDLAGNTLVAIKDLQTLTNGVTTQLSEIRYAGHMAESWSKAADRPGVLVCRSISRVQRADAGEYRCRLAIGPRLVESQPITLKVEGKLQLWFQHQILGDSAFSSSLVYPRRSAILYPPTGGSECNKGRSFHADLRGGRTS